MSFVSFSLAVIVIISSKMLFVLQVLRGLTLPLLTDREITCTGVG